MNKSRGLLVLVDLILIFRIEEEKIFYLVKSIFGLWLDELPKGNSVL